MTDNSERLREDPDGIPGPVPRSSNAEFRRTASTGNPGSGPPQSEMAGLVLLINTVLGGLGALYMTTGSAAITFVAALQVLLIIVVALVVKCRDGLDSRPGRKDDRSGR